MPQQQTFIRCVGAALLQPRGRAGRWVYLLAALLPGWIALHALFSPFQSYSHGAWLSAVLLVACLLQFHRPTLLLWLPVFSWYAWLSARAVWREIEAFQEYRTYGGEEHGLWEGWHSEWIFLAITIFLIAVTLAIAIQLRQGRACDMAGRSTRTTSG